MDDLGSPTPRRSGPGLAGKLMLASAALLLIPWFGYQALQATRDFLLEGQAQAQLMSAEAVANLFHGRQDLFARPPDVSNEREELPLYRLHNHILLDGLEEDWDVVAKRRQGFTGDSLHYGLVLGEREGQLYGLLRVTDATVINRHPGQTRLDSSDHVRLYFIDAQGQRRRFLLAFEGSGQISTYETDRYWKVPLDSSQARLFRGHVSRNDETYLLEFSLPLSWLGEQRRFGIAVADVTDGEQRRPGELLPTFSTSAGSKLNLLVERSSEIDRILLSLAPPDSRIWVIDSLGHVKAGRGPLEPMQDTSGLSGWPGLVAALQRAAGEWLLGIPRGPIEDFDPAMTAVRQDPLVQKSLAGEGTVERRAAVAGKATIIAAAQPVFAGDDVVGAVLVEKSTRQVLGLQRQAIERLAAFSAIALLLVIFALLGFAARLTYRIQRLDREAEAAIDAHGRLSVHAIRHELRASDEIGDLARGFNRVLNKLHGHQQFLTAIPRTLRHEINNPLNTISTSLEQLEQGSSGDDRLLSARRALERINLLVEQLCEAASLEEALQNEGQEPFDLRALLGDYCRNRRQRPPHPRLAVELPDQPVIITGSDFHIEQLLDKLVDNAIDFARPDTTIEVNLSHRGDHCELTISNRGPTLADPENEEIFQLMHSAREGSAKQGHFGLGLYIARLISEFHGGRIKAANLEDATGVSLQVVLPLR